MPKISLALGLLAVFSLISVFAPTMACSGDGPCAVGHVWKGEPTGKNEM